MALGNFFIDLAHGLDFRMIFTFLLTFLHFSLLSTQAPYLFHNVTLSVRIQDGFDTYPVDLSAFIITDVTSPTRTRSAIICLTAQLIANE